MVSISARLQIHLLLLFTLPLCGQVNVLTNRYDISRTAANLNETTLTDQNIRPSSFGKLGVYLVDGVIYSQPLIVRNLQVPGKGLRDVLYVATMHDLLYAFDADSPGVSLWTHDFCNPAAGIAYVRNSDPSVGDFGIFSTPIIDVSKNRIYLVTETDEKGVEVFRLHMVDIRSGVELSETAISATTATAKNGSLTFITPKYSQRPALALASGQVFVAFGSRAPGDQTPPYYGWIMTYDQNTLQQTGVLTTSNTNGASIWQSGAGPAIDQYNNLYYLTGNDFASAPTYNPAQNLPESLVQVSYSTGLRLLDWFTPFNYLFLDEQDLDLSCNGPMLIPGTNDIVFGSKTADVYVASTSNLGKLTPADSQLVQQFHVGLPATPVNDDFDRIVGMVYWQRPTGSLLYVWPGQDTLHAYTFTGGRFELLGYDGLTAPGLPSVAMSLSANGAESGTGILWATLPAAFYNNSIGRPGVIHAYNAEDGSELWNSTMNLKDDVGSLAKYVIPVVANGRVYMATSGGSVAVYGLLASNPNSK